jgi:hypothetical protein
MFIEECSTNEEVQEQRFQQQIGAGRFTLDLEDELFLLRFRQEDTNMPLSRYQSRRFY